MSQESLSLPEDSRDTSLRGKTPDKVPPSDAPEASAPSRGKVGRILDVVRRLITPIAPIYIPRDDSHSGNEGPSDDSDMGLQANLSLLSSFDSARGTFTKVYSAKPGKIFFIDTKGNVEREVTVPARLVFLQGSRNPKDREVYKKEFPIFMSGLEKEASKGSIHMASGEKFRLVLRNAATRMGVVRSLLEKAFKHKSQKDLSRDTENLWDVLAAEDRVKLLDLCMGIFGVESSFDPNTKGGIAQFTPQTLVHLNMSAKDARNVGKSVLKVPKLFEDAYRVLKQKNGATEVISRYGLKDGHFLVYALVDSYHAGSGNVLALCRSLLEDYPRVGNLPRAVRLNSEDLYTFMTHRGKNGSGSYGAYSALYVPQVSAMTERLKAGTGSKTANGTIPTKVAPRQKNR